MDLLDLHGRHILSNRLGLAENVSEFLDFFLEIVIQLAAFYLKVTTGFQDKLKVSLSPKILSQLPVTS